MIGTFPSVNNSFIRKPPFNAVRPNYAGSGQYLHVLVRPRAGENAFRHVCWDVSTLTPTQVGSDSFTISGSSASGFTLQPQFIVYRPTNETILSFHASGITAWNAVPNASPPFFTYTGISSLNFTGYISGTWGIGLNRFQGGENVEKVSLGNSSNSFRIYDISTNTIQTPTAVGNSVRGRFCSWDWYRNLFIDWDETGGGISYTFDANQYSTTLPFRNNFYYTPNSTTDSGWAMIDLPNKRYLGTSNGAIISRDLDTYQFISTTTITNTRYIKPLNFIEENKILVGNRFAGTTITLVDIRNTITSLSTFTLSTAITNATTLGVALYSPYNGYGYIGHYSTSTATTVNQMAVVVASSNTLTLNTTVIPFTLAGTDTYLNAIASLGASGSYTSQVATLNCLDLM